MLDRLRERARILRRQAVALARALTDRRVPWFARGVIFLTLAYAVSPIDLIPDFIPVVGLLDDLLIVPLGLALAIRLIPADVWDELQQQGENDGTIPHALRTSGLVIVVLLWLLALTLTARFLASLDLH